MSVKNWNTLVGLFSSASSWLPSETPIAGDNLYINNGSAILFNESFGSESAASSVGLIGGTSDNRPQLIIWNVTLNNVAINNASQPYTGPASERPADYYAPKFGRLLIGGVVTNEGGSVTAAGNISLLGGNSLDMVILPGSTFINNGSLGVDPGSTMRITGYDGSTLENDKSINDSSGRITIAAHLTGTGDVYVSGGAGGGSYSGNLEINAAVDAGQSFHLNRAVLQVDQPAGFLGQFDALPSQGGGEVRLEGLSAASWDVNGSSVELFDAAGSVVDTVGLTASQTPF